MTPAPPSSPGMRTADEDESPRPPKRWEYGARRPDQKERPGPV